MIDRNWITYFTDAVVAGKAKAVEAATPVRSERATAAVAMNLVMMISGVFGWWRF